MAGGYYMVLDAKKVPMAGPFHDETAARLWVAFNRHRYTAPPSIAYFPAEWFPTALYRSLEEVPRWIWERQVSGDLIVVEIGEGRVEVFA